MTMHDKINWNNIAQALDGEPVELTAEERRLVDETRSDQQALAGMLDVPVPAVAMQRAHRRLTAAAGASMWKHVRIAFFGGVCAAAMLVISIGLLNLLYPLGARLMPGSSITYSQAMALWQPAVEAEQLREVLWTLDDTSPAPRTTDSEIDKELDEFWQEWLDEDTNGQLEGRIRPSRGGPPAA